MQTKTCTSCGESLPATKEFFYKNKNAKCGLRARCKTCTNKTNLEWRTSNPEKISNYNKKQYDLNPELRRDNRRKNYKKNKDHCREYSKKYYREKLISEGKEFGAMSPKTNFYIGYVTLDSGTYFKPGITSYDSMYKRYKRDCVYAPQLISIEELDFFRFDTEEEARSMENEFLSHCKIIMGEPTVGREWWKLS